MNSYKGTIKDKLYLVLVLIYQIYIEMRDRTIYKYLNKDMVKPWMRHRELTIILEVIENLQPKKCLEWGSGYSTLIFPELIHGDFKWISLEHDKKWSEKIKDMNDCSNVEIHHISTDCSSSSKNNNNFKEYVEFPNKFGKFDLIFVDGRAREKCLIKGYKLLEDDGVIILHDANREKYHKPLELYKQHSLFQDLREEDGGIWLGSKKCNLEEVLDLEKHKDLWNLYRKVGKLSKRI